jgi:hypothetical protein
LGLYQVDAVSKSVRLRFADAPVEACEGRIPTPDGFVSLRWTREGSALTYQLDVPAGYKVEVESLGAITATARRFPHGKVSYGYKVDGGYK